MSDDTAPAEAIVDIVLLDVGPRRAGVIELVRRRQSGILNVKQVMKLVDSAPSVVLAEMPLVQAEAVKLELEALGARVELAAPR